MQSDEKAYFECTNVYTKDFVKEYNRFFLLSTKTNFAIFSISIFLYSSNNLIYVNYTSVQSVYR